MQRQNTTQVLQFTEPPHHLNATPSDATAQPRAATPPAEAEDTEEDLSDSEREGNAEESLLAPD